jgi:allantoinase
MILRSTRVVTGGKMIPAAIRIHEGKIAAIEPYETSPDADFVDAVILPGLVDTHVHINEPGRTGWEGFDTATRAAAAGGVTTLIEMPLNSIPATTSVAAFEQKLRAADGALWGGRPRPQPGPLAGLEARPGGRARVGGPVPQQPLADHETVLTVDTGFWGGVVPGNVSELEPLWRAGVFGFKCFLAPSGVEEFEHVTVADLCTAMPVLARLGAPLLVHAEAPAYLREPQGGSHEDWLASRPAEAECEAIAMMIRLARETGARVHIVHLSAAEALPMLDEARHEGVPITVETCPHYLCFAAEEIPAAATEFKCAPPLRSRENRTRLREALRRGEIDLVASDHSPSPPALKRGDFRTAWGGIASLELGLSAMATIFESPIDLARWMAEGPARLAGVATKGRIAPGCDADLVIFDPDQSWICDPERLHQRHKMTPYAGREMRGRVTTTYLRGEKIYDDGEFPSRPPGRVITR